MTIPPGAKQAFGRVSDFVREMIPALRDRVSPIEADLALHLRTNEPLYRCLTEFLRARIEARARVPEPAEPLLCKSMLARDREVQAILSRLEALRLSPVNEPRKEDEGEQPAA